VKEGHLPSTTLGVRSLSAQDHETEMDVTAVCHTAVSRQYWLGPQNDSKTKKFNEWMHYLLCFFYTVRRTSWNMQIYTGNGRTPIFCQI